MKSSNKMKKSKRVEKEFVNNNHKNISNKNNQNKLMEDKNIENKKVVKNKKIEKENKIEKGFGASWYIAGISLLALLLVEFMFGSLSGASELARLFVVAAIALFVIIQSANYAVDAISDYARTTGLSDYIIGFLVVAIGTAFPDISTAIFASLANNGSLVLGSVMGASIMNLTLIIGLMAVIGGKLKIDASIQKTVALILTFILVAVFLGADGVYSRANGITMLLILIVYVTVIILKEGQTGKVKESIPFKHLWVDIVVFGGTLAALLLSARWLVVAATQIATILNIPNYFVGLVLVAVGTTMPEAIVGVKSVLDGVTNIGIGNLIGGIMMNFFLVLGLAAVINPITFDFTSFFVSAWVLLFATTLVLLSTKQKEISWKHGLLLLALYAGFIYIQFTLI